MNNAYQKVAAKLSASITSLIELANRNATPKRDPNPIDAIEWGVAERAAYAHVLADWGVALHAQLSNVTTEADLDEIADMMNREMYSRVDNLLHNRDNNGYAIRLHVAHDLAEIISGRGLRKSFKRMALGELEYEAGRIARRLGKLDSALVTEFDELGGDVEMLLAEFNANTSAERARRATEERRLKAKARRDAAKVVA